MKRLHELCLQCLEGMEDSPYTAYDDFGRGTTYGAVDGPAGLSMAAVLGPGGPSMATNIATDGPGGPILGGPLVA